MKTLTSELQEYGLTPEQIARINATLTGGKTVRRTYTVDIDCIYVNDESTVTIVVIDDSGREREVERSWE